MPDLINVSDWHTPLRIPVRHQDFDLAATLECGQAFRWRRDADGWHVGVVAKGIWRVRQDGNTVAAVVSRGPSGDDGRAYQARLQHHLALDVSLAQIVATFPADDQMLHAAVRQHRGLRVLRQEPWECLASFIASSSKQIVQIRQIVELLARQLGEPIDENHFAFPSVSVVAGATHQQLWDCKLGFRAKNLLAAARMIDSGKLDLDALPSMEYEQALEELMRLPGVGEKIANCTLLFACGFNQAFPIDVWIERALRRIYFDEAGGGSGLHPRPVALEKRSHKKVTARQLREFARSHFGPYAGWAQQYLFFNERLLGKHRARRSQPLLDVGTK